MGFNIHHSCLYQVTAGTGHILLGVGDLPQQQLLHVHAEVLDEGCRSTQRSEVQPFVHRDRLSSRRAVKRTNGQLKMIP